MRRIVAVLVLAAAMAGCGNKVPPLSPVGPNDVIVAFGDSLTYGTGAAESESYPAVLAQLIERKVIRAGVPGEVTEQGLARLQEVIEEHRPALMIVCLGGNDMLRHAADAQISANLREIIKTIRGQGIGVMEFGIPYEGTIVTDVLYQRDLKSDPIHPNAKGYRKMAEAIASLLKKAGAI
jgi:acyl-CoA thioesterase I